MKILKASAGSGKTYRLSKTYIDLLLSSREPHPYRHILAVTFTNKATAEMKNRILKDLAVLAETDPRAKALLTDLLHDYGAFSVSTIDKFFQQALKAFSREIGQFADYQIELDKDSLIAETMDRILDSLTEDSGELLDWIQAALADALELGRRFRVDEGLMETGKLLKNDEFRELSERLGVAEKGLTDTLRADFIRIGLPVESPYPADTLVDAVAKDKKAAGGKVRFVLLQAPGHVILKDLDLNDLHINTK